MVVDFNYVVTMIGLVILWVVCIIHWFIIRSLDEDIVAIKEELWSQREK